MSLDTTTRRDALLGAGRPALLVVDVQRDFADPVALEAWGMDEAARDAVAAAVEGCHRLVVAARAAGVPVVWIELAYDPARPWRASAWLQTGDLDAPTGDFPCVVGTPGADWWRLEPGGDELRVRKRFYSGFAGTDLGDELRRLGIGWVTVAGLTTECCVQATVFDAAQRDLPALVVEDATAAASDDVHRAALRTMAANAAVVETVDDVVELWGAVR